VRLYLERGLRESAGDATKSEMAAPNAKSDMAEQTPRVSQQILLTHGEKFSGLLVGLLSNTLSSTKAGFEAVNVALKRQAEQKHPV
jgi:hypothetical protein